MTENERENLYLPKQFFKMQELKTLYELLMLVLGFCQLFCVPSCVFV